MKGPLPAFALLPRLPVNNVTENVSKSDINQFNKLADSITGAKKYLLSRDPIPTEIKGVRCLPWQQGIAEILKIKI